MPNDVPPTTSWTYSPRSPYPYQELVQRYLDRIGPTCGPAVLMKCRGACRHFVIWLDEQSIEPEAVDRETVAQFGAHDCSCHGYTKTALTRPQYISRVRYFVRFLQEEGITPSFEGEIDMGSALVSYREHLLSLGYSKNRYGLLANEAEHLATWLREEAITWEEMDETVLARFVAHKCICPLKRRRGTLAVSGACRRQRAGLAFLTFLPRQGMLMAPPSPPRSTEEELVGRFATWRRTVVGATPLTVKGDVHELQRWLPRLGSDPRAYRPAAIRQIVLDQPSERAPASVLRTRTTLRAFLKFLSFEGSVDPHLVEAVPAGPRFPRDRQLPRSAPPDKIEDIIAACDPITRTGIRDKAIILLLARLGLRAGDVAGLRFDAVDWEAGTVTVSGKGRRATRLPLPQDVGEAILAYGEQTRPKVREPRIFLRVNAPYRPFSSSGEISGIVARHLRRAGIEDVPSGAHMFRHSLATSMLRSGSSFETIGTVLRHKNPATTAIYAKVDVPMLLAVAQSWPGETSC